MSDQPHARQPHRSHWLQRAAFLLTVAAVVFGLAGFTLYRDQQRLRERASTTTQNIATLLDQSIVSAFDKVDAVLLSAEQLYLRRAPGGLFLGLPQAELNAQLQQLAARVPEAFAIRIVDRDGVLRFGSDVLPAQRMSYADRAFFTRLRDDPRLGRVVDGPLLGRQHDQWIVVLARPLLDSEGRFAGVIYANFRTAFFEKILSAPALGPQGAATVRTTDMALLHRYPNTQGAVGNRNVSKALADAIRASPQAGEYIAATALDGIERSNAYRRVADLPFYVIVGTATLNDTRQLLRNGGVLFILATCALGLATAVVWVNVRNERRLKADISARKHINEALQREVDERRRAEAQATQALRYSRGLIEGSLDPLVVIDRQGLITDGNQAFDTFTGLPREQLVGQEYALWCVLPEAMRLTIAAAFLHGSVHRQPLDMRQASGEVKHTLFSANIYRGPDDEVAGLVVTVHDTTEQRRAEQYMRVAAAAFEAQEGMMVTDAQHVILRVNKAFTRITGYSADEAVGQTPGLLRSGHHTPDFYSAMYQSLAETSAWQGEVWNRRKSGQVYPQWLTITAVRDADGCLDNYVSTLSDITFRKEAEDKIKVLAYFDALTGLANRRMLMDRLGHALASSNRSGHFGALLFIDLDRFKNVNDTLGHDYGDLLLQQVGQRITAQVRENDTVARLGGDEFVVMLDALTDRAETSADHARLVGEKLLAAIAEPYFIKGMECRSSPSIGITLFMDHHHTVEEVLRQADLAMYQAKGGGRNGLRFFDPAMDAEVARRAALENDLRSAIESELLELHYQPQVNGRGQAVGVEALVRWMHPVRGRVSPAEFIPIAEESGLILGLGAWVLDEACRQLAAWATHPQLQRLTVAVNISARQIQQDDFVQQVRAVVKRHGIEPRRLKLELTESVLISDIQGIADKMVALQLDGIRFALDDFGTGFSSLSYLKRLPLDQLKIDSSFVRDILVDPSDKAIAQLVISLGNSLELEVIAEGVETEEQSAMLASLGCHRYQGYLYGKPCCAEQLEALVGGAEACAE
jgi:diguanylate cyclase (GGDEF)-like protein/PAS domain S-box-containing protein